MRIWRLSIHRKDQWDLGVKPLVCLHWYYSPGQVNGRRVYDGCRRLFCIPLRRLVD